MHKIMIIINSPKPLNSDGLVIRILLIFIPHGESAFPRGVALDIDVGRSQGCLVGLCWVTLTDHLGMLFVHWDYQLFGH